MIVSVLLCGSTLVGSGGEEPIPTDTIQTAATNNERTELTRLAVTHVTAETTAPTAQPEATQEDFENEKIEEALLEQNYLSDEIPLDYDTQACLRAWCEQYSVPYSLALAVIEAESTFRADASNGSCYGYMQINSVNLEWLGEQIGVTDLTDPLQNLHSGVFILANLNGKYEDWNKALVCYNCGEAGAYEYVFSQGYTSSQYSRHVLELQEAWKEVVGE